MSDERGPPSDFGVSPAAPLAGGRPIAAPSPLRFNQPPDPDQNHRHASPPLLFPRRLIGWFFKAIGAFILLSVLMVVLYRFVPPPITLTMLGDAVERARHHQILDAPVAHGSEHGPRRDRRRGRKFLHASRFRFYRASPRPMPATHAAAASAAARRSASRPPRTSS